MSTFHSERQTMKQLMDEPMPVNACGKYLQQTCHGQSERSGWWTDLKSGASLKAMLHSPNNRLEELLADAIVAQKLALVHSEISEALEGHRKKLMDDKLAHRPMVEVELADAIIRIFDLAGAMNLDLGGAIAEKLAFNAIREDHKPEARQSAGGKSY